MKTQLKLLFMTGVFLLSCFVLAGQVPVDYGKLKRFENFPSASVKVGNIDVWPPEGYNSDKKYAVVFRYDEPLLFDSTTTPNRLEWSSLETVKLIDENTISDRIVEGFWNTNLLHAEIFPKITLEYLYDTKKTEVLNTTFEADKQRYLYDATLSDKYLKSLDLEFKPFIDNSFSTLEAPANSVVVSSDVGGLISISNIIEYPETFIESGRLSKHWPGTFKMAENPNPVSCLKYLNDNLPLHQNHKIYLNYGTENLDPNYKPNQQQAALIMKLKDYPAVNWITKTFAGASHNERPWNKRFYVSLKFLFGK